MKLIFVYNATSGRLGSLLASAHKFFSTNTYHCDLCSLTFGVFSENRHWRAFRKSSNLEMVFLHKDQFLRQYKSKWLPKYNFPVILSQDQDMLEIFLSSVDIENIKDAEVLIDAVQSRLRKQF
jgi:hypothetical protein